MTRIEDLRERRARVGLGLREAARKLAITAPYLADIERGRRTPSPDLVAGIARVYDLPEGDLRALWGRPAGVVGQVATQDPIAAEKVPALLQAAKGLTTADQWDELVAAAQSLSPQQVSALNALTGFSRWAKALVAVLDKLDEVPKGELRALGEDLKTVGAELVQRGAGVPPTTSARTKALRGKFRAVERRVARLSRPPATDQAPRARARQTRKRPRSSNRRRAERRARAPDSEGGSTDEPPPPTLTLARCRELIPGLSDAEIARMRDLAVLVAEIRVRAELARREGP